MEHFIYLSGKSRVWFCLHTSRRNEGGFAESASEIIDSCQYSREKEGNIMASQTNRSLSAYQLTSILLMAAGIGWINGNFVQPVAYAYGVTADTIHFIPLVILVVLVLGYSRALSAGKLGTGWNAWLCVHATSSILTCVVFIILGVMNTDPNSIGVHNFEDLMPVIVLTAGSLLWFATVSFARRPSQVSAKQVPNLRLPV